MKNIALVVLSLLLLLGGILLFGMAFTVADQWRAAVFFGGILTVALAFALPLTILSATRR